MVDNNLIKDIRAYINNTLQVKIIDNFEKLSIEEKKEKLKSRLLSDFFLIKKIPAENVENSEIIKLINEYCYVSKPSITIKDKKKNRKSWIYQNKTKSNWYFSERYQQYLLYKKNWAWGNINSLNESTDTILDLCGNPLETESFSYKGLVVGDIQSGKTANYTNLINKAFDAGYKLVIVLAGITNELRSQTQKRLDKEVLGYETRPDFHKGAQIGVGEISFEKDKIIGAFTDSDNNGDLKNVNTSIPLGGTPLIAIVKKNKSVLENLINYIKDNPSVSINSGKLNAPVLIIDDEVDQASVNTKKSLNLEEASTINKLIRKLLSKFERYSYVGYTATPFANVFVYPYTENQYKEEEKDIFPEDFIHLIETPPGYSGIQDYFGTDEFDDHDLIVPIDENDIKEFFGANKTKATTQTVDLADSLKEAIKHFVISVAVKISRGIIENNSMLINITSNVYPMQTLQPLVSNFVIELKGKYKFLQKEKENFKQYWEDNIKEVSKDRLGKEYIDNWDKIKLHIETSFDLLKTENIKLLSGNSMDVFNYSSINQGSYIIIGGAKLSRGLTLDGLLVSYFYRKTKTFDTLMQMGRWFGYRQGWLDLTRIWTDLDIVDDFYDVSLAVKNFKTELRVLKELELTPSEFGLKIQRSPNLVPTAANKLHHAVKQRIGFAGTIQQTISFDLTKKETNLSLVENLVKAKKVIPIDKGLIIDTLTPLEVITFLSSFKEAGDIGRISVLNWIKYIQKANENNELTNWKVVVHSLKSRKAKSLYKLGKYEISKPVRSLRIGQKENSSIATIKVLTNPDDFSSFFYPATNETKEITSYKPESELIKSYFGPRSGLLTIYIFDLIEKYDKKKDNAPIYIERGENLVGIGVWFPMSEKMKDASVEYYINPILLEEYKKTLEEIEKE